MNTSQSIMNDQHRATASEWACIRPSVAPYSCILELLHRIEALEAAQPAHADASHVIDPEREKAARKLMEAAGFALRSNVKQAAFAISESFRAASAKVRPSEVATTEAQPNYPEISDSSPLCVRCWAAAAAHTRTKPNHPEIPDGSLLSRVACADGPADAILEVAAWLREQGCHDWAAVTLKEEAKR